MKNNSLYTFKHCVTTHTNCLNSVDDKPYLANLYERLYTETTSYFQIAGIHGLRSDWNEFGIPEGKNEFCVHSLPTFPTWHRPYNALIDVSVDMLGKCLLIR